MLLSRSGCPFHATKVFRPLEEQGICLPKRQPCHTTKCPAGDAQTNGAMNQPQHTMQRSLHRFTAAVPTASAALAAQSCGFTCCCKHTQCHANARRPNTAHPPHKPAGGCVHTQLTLLSEKPRRSKHRAHLHTHRMLSSAAAKGWPTPLQHRSAQSTATTPKLVACSVQGKGAWKAVPGS